MKKDNIQFISIVLIGLSVITLLNSIQIGDVLIKNYDGQSIQSNLIRYEAIVSNFRVLSIMIFTIGICGLVRTTYCSNN